MSYTLKIVSRMLDQVGQPQKQVWFPGVTMVSRIAQTSYKEMRDGAWAAYGQTDFDFVTPGIGQSWAAADVRKGMKIYRNEGCWTVTNVERTESAKNGMQVTVDFESPGGQAGEREVYDGTDYLREYQPAAEIERFNPPVTLLWVTLPQVSVHMIAEQAFLLGPDGGTIDRITGPGY